MAPTKRTRGNPAALAGRSGGSKKRPRSKLTVDLSGGHGGKYEDAIDDDDITPTLHDEELDSGDDDGDLSNDGMMDGASEDEEEDSEEEETVDQKKLRLARDYLSKMEAQQSSEDEDESDSDGGDDTDAYRGGSAMDKIGKRIAKERLRKSGLLQSHIADSILEGIQTMRGKIASKIGIDAASQAWMGGSAAEGASTESYAKSWLDAKYVTYHRGHDLTPTSVALSHDGSTAFSGAKDGSLVMWNVEEGRKVSCILPAVKHFGGDESSNNSRNQREILAIATSDDDRYMAVGGRDNCVRIFDIRTLGKGTTASSPISTFEGHKKAVTSLAFRSRTLDLYSGSEDRCIRRYDLDAMTYVETLYGHQSPVLGINCANKNRPVSIARDRTVRVWKVEEDSHLVFRPGGDVGSAECVSAVRDGWFVTGHDDGRLALWREEKKRPVGDVVVAAHGYEGGGGGVTRSVMCCDALGLSDVLATGSNDGYLRFWRLSTEEKGAGIKPLDTVPIHGHINSIAMGPGGKFCVAAVGQEPRLGRWNRVPRAKNRFAIIRLNSDGEADS
eukprot:CAMPEP_0183760460 /NCGR_PEP_ID=MMETSP0739-20130205/7786_1 /TAXON_ID=385413 /ORGANISM="Thalassiosira miniscula, Strain CCMP1093" /LENGTH=556 /DNA_ID=CAMNT_0025998449 /DNA_START=27 /DNA_END=1697 /DNA_ORIENTATION=-